ncbi:uncharacterized protein [Bactrocera oleae]|uniref:uncharacterized protein n=1 Tax=Bactrocera oleae TaxID=104688 RepID=UPI00387E342C
MAKISSIDATDIGGVNANSAGDDNGIFAMLACVGVFICMISTLVGIKIWWFKHRLTFDHSRTSNGAAGGATPTLPLRTRSSREKRISQEIREPVEVHGVFRRRQEDDLDIVPTKQLPPVRIRNLSQSTPSLFPLPPTRRQDRVRSAIFEEYEPPTREPPTSPVDSPPPQHTPTISLVEEMPTFDELEEKYRQMELNEIKANEVNVEGSDESILRERGSPPLPPKRINRNSSKEANYASAVGMHKFVKAKSPSLDTVRTQQNLSERRATGYLRPDEVDIKVGLAEARDLKAIRAHSVEEFGERRPTGYIKYEEIDTDGLEDFRNKWDALQTSFGAQSPIFYESSERTAFESMHGHNYDHLNRASAGELRTVADGAPTANANVGRGANTAARFSWQTDKRLTGKQVRPESQASIVFTSDEEYAEELDGFKPQTIMKSATVADCTGYENVEPVRPQTPEVAYAPTRVVKFANPELGEQETLLSHTLNEEKETLKMRRPTGYVRTVQPEELWDEMEANINHDEKEKHLWLEIEKDVNLNRDFASNIEEEFDKIRHSYEENEAAFLEGNNSLKRLPKQVLITTPEPEGFGKSIDEDWASFENLREDKPKCGEETGKQIVQFKLSDLEDAYDKESILRTERRPTAFVRNTEQIHRELSNIDDEDESAATTSHYQTSSVEFVDEVNESATKSFKERRPTSYVRPQISDLDEDYVHEHNKDSIFEPVEEPLTVQTEATARPRARQKVTFDFSNTEYFQTSPGREEQEALTSFSTITNFASSDSDTAGEDEAASQYFPKAMQRITKNHYLDETIKDVGSDSTQDQTLAGTISPTPVRLLFGTQVSLEQAESEINDSWAAIRHRRQTTTTSTPLTPILTNAGEPPKPSYRNPLAQTTTVQSVTLMEERVATQQHMSTFQPHAAARHQYFEQSYYNSTEA